MQLLEKNQILGRLNLEGDGGIFIDPILELSQIGDVTVDLRLGYDFLVSVLSRRPSVSLIRSAASFSEISTFFQFTRRDLGDTFVLYPGQIALTTTLEYVGLPAIVYADVLSRSSYTRLGISLNTMVQPGFRGTFSLELMNSGTNPIELIVGSRVVQVRFFETAETHDYVTLGRQRKYYGDVRPRLSGAQRDTDLLALARLAAAS